MDKVFAQTELNSEFKSLISQFLSSNDPFIQKGRYLICPGFCDVHVHFREPGFCYKETIKSGSMAAAAGGYTTVLTMPNLNPVPDSAANLKVQLDAIRRDAVIEVIPYGSITVGQKGECLADMDAMAKDVCAFSDDGRGVQDEQLMVECLKKTKALGKLTVAHCEDNSLLFGGYIHDGLYAKQHGHKGICSASEYVPVQRDVALAARVGARYHVCHVSTKESVQAIREAKANGVDVSAETGPHYLVMTDMDLQEDGRFKMNPPLRAEDDRLALIKGLLDGTIDMLATDHAPHSEEEKSKGLQGSAFGIVGLETAFPVLYTDLVKTGVMPLGKVIELMTSAPRARFDLELRRNDYTVFDLEAEYEIDPKNFLSKGKNTPFTGKKVFGKCIMTVHNGNTAYLYKENNNG